MRILIVAHYFPPEDGGAVMASQRPYSWAKYWSKMGHDITVLTTAKRVYNDPNFATNFQIQGVNYWAARPQTGLQDQKSPQQSISFKQRITPLLRKLLVTIHHLLGTGTLLFASNAWVYPAVKQAIRLHKAQPFDVIVSTYGPPCSHWVGGILKRRLNTFWVADYRDLWFGYDFLITRWPFSRLEEKLENYLLSKADLITTVSDGFTEQLSQRFQKQTITITNGFDLEERPIIPSLKKDNTSKITIVHTGNIYPGKRDPTLLFQSLNYLRQKLRIDLSSLEILFYGWDFGNLPELVEEYQLQATIQLAGFIERKQALEIQQQADILLYLDWQDPKVNGIIGGKLYEYMFSGTPILAINASPNTAAGQIITDCQLGICAGHTTTVIANHFKNLLANPVISYQPNLEKLKEFTREGLAQKMLNSITEYLFK